MIIAIIIVIVVIVKPSDNSATNEFYSDDMTYLCCRI